MRLSGLDHDPLELSTSGGNGSDLLQLSQAVFPAAISTAVVYLIDLLHSHDLTGQQQAISSLANRIILSCLIEDAPLFLRFFFEKITQVKISIKKFENKKNSFLRGGGLGVIKPIVNSCSHFFGFNGLSIGLFLNQCQVIRAIKKIVIQEKPKTYFVVKPYILYLYSIL